MTTLGQFVSSRSDQSNYLKGKNVQEQWGMMAGFGIQFDKNCPEPICRLICSKK
jgi:hypothetical protein